MASADRTTNHDQIRAWAESRGGIPTIVKGTGGLLRIDFVEGAASGGREDSLAEVTWEEWFQIFEDSALEFLYSPEPASRFFKLVRGRGVERENGPETELEPEAELGATPAADAPPKPSRSGRVDLNTAGTEELTSISGIDGARARHILDYRDQHGPFRSWEDVDQVPGIGETLLQRLEESATVGGERKPKKEARKDEQRAER